MVPRHEPFALRWLIIASVYRLREISSILILLYPRNMETTTSDQLQCCECEGVLLPDRPIPLKNESWVLRYVSIDCKSRSYAVPMGSAVRMYP
jgi:hypothetical protein